VVGKDIRETTYFYLVSDSFLIFLDCFPDSKLYISEQKDNLDLESVQSGRYRTATASVRVNSLAIFFFVIVLQRVNKME
jgi:hypothetical protein